MLYFIYHTLCITNYMTRNAIACMHVHRNAKYKPHEPESAKIYTEKWLRDLIKIQELKEAERRTEVGARRAFKDMANGNVPRLISYTIVTKHRSSQRNDRPKRDDLAAPATAKKRQASNNPSNNKRYWNEEEDKKLTELVNEYGAKNWKKIAQHLPHRTDVQCLHRWQKVLNPMMVKGPWSREED